MDTRFTPTLIALLFLAALVAGWWLMRSRANSDDMVPDASYTAASESEMASPAAVEPLGGTMPDVLVDPRIVIRKAARRLHLYSDGELVKSYLVALGSDPVGDKEREGDGRTPEGGFYICTRNPESAYQRSLGLSYPNQEDADRGLESGLISTREYRRITDALAHLRQPPWNTALGGEIMIHGHGTHADWTAGCIALSDADIEELFDAIPLGTPVTVEP